MPPLSAGCCRGVWKKRVLLWKQTPVGIQPNSFIYLPEPEEEQRMYRESFHLAIYGFLEPVCPWFFKSSPVFRAWGSRRPFLMIDSSLKGP